MRPLIPALALAFVAGVALAGSESKEATDTVLIKQPLHGMEGKVAHAQLLVRQGKYSEALPMLRRAQSLEPSPSVQEYLDQIERYAQNR